jgi:Tfp pilus assembly protein PilO
MKSMHLNIEKQTIVTVGIFSGIILLIVLGIIIPTARYITRLNNETATLKEYLERKYEATTHLRSSIKQIEEIKLAVNEYPKYFFKPGDELALITALENIANKNKVTQRIENSNLDQKASESIKVSLSVNGKYEKTLNYLSDLEKLNYFINIEKIQLTSAGLKPGESASSTLANLYLDFSLYVNQ